MKDEDKSPADLLEQALKDLETRKKAAADMAANMAPELERLDALQKKLDALPQSERRQVLDAMGLKHVSAAPKPITPLRGTGSAPSRQPQPANWNKWKLIPKCELWKAVCLSLDIEPNAEKHGMVSWLQSRRGVPYGFPEDFADRLQIAQANVSTNGPIHPQSLYVGVLKNPRAEVLLSEVAAASVRWGWTLPQAMQSLAWPGIPEPLQTKTVTRDTEIPNPIARLDRTPQQVKELDAMRVPPDGGISMASRLRALNGLAPQSEPVLAESPSDGADQTPDPERRLALLRALGGTSKYARGEWKFTGIGALVESEKDKGRKRSDEKTIRADLKDAAQTERDAKSAGFGSGLGKL